jgi:hypothetical protein
MAGAMGFDRILSNKISKENNSKYRQLVIWSRLGYLDAVIFP